MTKYEVSGGLISFVLLSIASSWQTVAIVFSLYVIALAGNLFTGLFCSYQTKTYSSKIANEAIWKKAGVLIGIVVFILVDWIVMGLSRSAGVTYTLPFFACVFAGYNAAHELGSMIANIKKLGNSVPQVIEDAAKKAEDALSQGKMPDLTSITKSDTKEE